MNTPTRAGWNNIHIGYREGFRWESSTQDFLEQVVIERPLLNVCSGRSGWGDVTLDLFEKADVQADWKGPWPFPDNCFGAVFADPPWSIGYRKQAAFFVREALRVAPVAYLFSPWTYGSKKVTLTHFWVRMQYGVNVPILLTRYERSV